MHAGFTPQVELGGGYGSSQPSLTAFAVAGAGAAYGAGDVYTLSFDRPTDRGGVRGGARYVDSLFAFTAPIGADYSGEWADASTFRLVVLDLGGRRSPVDRLAHAAPAGAITNPARTSQPSSAAAAITTDLSQQYSVAPKIAAALAFDPTNNDTALGPGDMLGERSCTSIRFRSSPHLPLASCSLLITTASAWKPRPVSPQQ